jgi:predicted DNA-binding transcriptional regulator YafY
MARRAQRGPANRAALLAAVVAAEGPEAYGGATGPALIKRFEADKRRLRERLGAPLRYDPAAGGYVLDVSVRPLLDLPDDDLITLALLAETFRPDSPHAEGVQALIDRLAGWLPDDRRLVFQRAAGRLPSPDLRQRDSEHIPPNVWRAVLEAHRTRRELEFDYRAGDDRSVRVRRHHVQPWDVEFTDRGHWRLRAFCLASDGPGGPEQPADYRHYRLSRMVAGSARVLPRVLPPQRPRGRPRHVLFELSPTVARFGVSARRELVGEPTLQLLPNGWTRVEGQTLDVFELARNLLYYGPHCRVLGGPELLAEVRGLVEGLAGVYGIVGDGGQ